jgi:hypothetical protein
MCKPMEKKTTRKVDSKRAYFYLITLYQKFCIELIRTSWTTRKLLSMVVLNSKLGWGENICSKASNILVGNAHGMIPHWSRGK